MKEREDEMMQDEHGRRRLNYIWKHVSSSLDVFHCFSELSRGRECHGIVYMLHAHVCVGSPGTVTDVQSDAGTL